MHPAVLSICFVTLAAALPHGLDFDAVTVAQSATIFGPPRGAVTQTGVSVTWKALRHLTYRCSLG